MELHLRAPGSAANLGPGFDALGLALTVYNRVTVRTRGGGGARFTVQGAGAGLLPEDESNLFYQAAAAAAGRAGRSLPGMDVEMTNGIPLARGLGSSSTAIATGVVAANHLCGEPFTESEVLNLAAELEGHPDNVSACLRGGLTVSALSPDGVACIRALPPTELRAVAVVPQFEVKTEAARASLPDRVDHGDATFNVGHACLLTAALMRGDLDVLRTAMQDRLHQPYRAPLVPGFDQVLEAAEHAGSLGACLSGAGPTVLALAVEGAEAVGQAMVQAWLAEGVQAEAMVLGIDPNGVVVE
jgi:homoserine kinase